jgi:hypothetical protein
MRYIVKDGRRIPLGAEAPPSLDPTIPPAHPPTTASHPTPPPPDRLAAILDTLAREVEQRHGSVEQLWEQLRSTVVARPGHDN